MKYVETIEEVSLGNYCIGCGVCAAVDSNVSMKESTYGTFIPVIETGKVANSSANNVCPFSTKKDEDDIAIESLEIAHEKGKYLDSVGYYDEAFVGHVQKGGFRKRGSSGGMVSWITNELFSNNEIDALIHVKPSSSNGNMFEYQISENSEEAKSGTSSRYYPIKLDEVLDLISKSENKRFAIVGLPCFIKAVRLLMIEDSSFHDKIKYCIGIVCGHLKSKAFAELLAWQQGCKPEDLGTVNFRTKLKYRGASSYGFTSISKSGVKNNSPMIDLYGGDWGLGLFKNNACDYCDDVFAETADVVIGDAWLGGYRKDSKGNNVVVSRNKYVTEMIQNGISCGELLADKVDINLALTSQLAGVRHRTEGLSFRLGDAIDKGVSIPKKRIAPNSFTITEKRKRIYLLRQIISKNSHDFFLVAKENKNLDVFFKLIKPISNYYEDKITKNKFYKIKKILFKVLNRFVRKITFTNNKELY